MQKFILTEQIRHIDIVKEKNKEMLKQLKTQETLETLLTLETLTPKGLNQELN